MAVAETDLSILSELPFPAVGLLAVALVACDRDSSLPGWGANLIPYGLQLGREHFSVLPTEDGTALKLNRTQRDGSCEEWVFPFAALRDLRIAPV